MLELLGDAQGAGWTKEEVLMGWTRADGIDVPEWRR
jgi:hypothetical protein